MRLYCWLTSRHSPASDSGMCKCGAVITLRAVVDGPTTPTQENP